MEHGYGACFYAAGVEIVGTAGVLFHGKPRRNVFVLPRVAQLATPRLAHGIAAAAVSPSVWHVRLAHPNSDALMRTSGMVHGLAMTSTHPRKELSGMCEPCVLAKQTRAPFPTSHSSTAKPMQLVHTDVCGPMPVQSIGGARYFVTLQDDYSGVATAIPIARTSEAGGAVRDIMRKWEVTTG